MKKIMFDSKRNQPKNYATVNVVPLKFYPYLCDLNHLYSQVDSSVIQNRDKEIDRVFNCLLRDKKKNAILVGEHGVGKTAILQKLVSKVITNDCPNEIKDYHFLLLDIPNILANIDKKEMEKKLEAIVKFVTNRNFNTLVVVVDQLHLVQLDYLLSYYFSIFIRTPNIGVIGMTTEDELYEFFQFDTKTLSRLEIIHVKEPELGKVYPMIKKIVARLEKRHGVKISRELIEYIISVSNAFDSNISNPELTVDMIEKSLIYAKRNNSDVVTKAHINKNFNFDYELYNRMSAEDKKIIAYHEAGHFTANWVSDNIRNFNTTAISIVPGEDFLGITAFEFNPEKQLSCDINYYIDNIAVDLAGRVAELILQEDEINKRYTSGASSDLTNATNTARAIITEFGMIENFGENMAFLGNYDFTDFSLLSNEHKNEISKEAKKLIELAFERAKKILTENRALLDRVAKELLNNEILDKKDLKRICKEVQNTK